jgi:hypothetical protein
MVLKFSHAHYRHELVFFWKFSWPRRGAHYATLMTIVFILHRKIFPIHHTYIYSLVSYLFIKQDQLILTCNSAVASLMLSRFFLIWTYILVTDTEYNVFFLFIYFQNKYICRFVESIIHVVIKVYIVIILETVYTTYVTKILTIYRNFWK